MKPLTLKPGRVQPIQQHQAFIEDLNEVFTTYREEIQLPSFVASNIKKLSELLSLSCLSQVQIAHIKKLYGSVSVVFPIPMPAVISE